MTIHKLALIITPLSHASRASTRRAASYLRPCVAASSAGTRRAASYLCPRLHASTCRAASYCVPESLRRGIECQHTTCGVVFASQRRRLTHDVRRGTCVPAMPASQRRGIECQHTTCGVVFASQRRRLAHDVRRRTCVPAIPASLCRGIEYQHTTCGVVFASMSPCVEASSASTRRAASYLRPCVPASQHRVAHDVRRRICVPAPASGHRVPAHDVRRRRWW